MYIYLITTIHNKETRWPYVQNHLKDIPYQAILAPDYRLFGGTSAAKHQSLTLAYLQIAQMAIYEGKKEYLVMEDDISLGETFADDIMKCIENVPEDCDFLYCTKTEHNRQAGETIPINDYICKVIDNYWETPITLWGTRMIEAFNERMMAKIGNEHFGHIDHEILKICQEGNLNFYGAEKNIANGLSTARHLADETISFEGSIS